MHFSSLSQNFMYLTDPIVYILVVHSVYLKKK